MTKPLPAYNIHDLRELARRRLPKGIFEMIDRGTEDEVALANNRLAFDRIKLVPHVLKDVSGGDPETTLFGHPASMPLAVAPTGFGGLAWYQGELKIAKAAAAANVPFTLATRSTLKLEKVADEAGGRLWFQLYLMSEHAQSLRLIERAKAAGIQALIITADTPVTPNREYNIRNGFQLPFRISATSAKDVMCSPTWFFTVLLRYLLTTGMPGDANSPKPAMNKTSTGAVKLPFSDKVSWGTLREVRKLWPGPLMLKGVLRPDDARKAVECGVDGIVVSNHGGRNLDSALASIDALPGIVDAVSDRVTVILDSGVRRGSDIFKALALGAKAVLVGRATLYGTAAAGEQGASLALEILKSELRRTMAMTGCKSLSDIDRDLLYRHDFTAGKTV